MARIIMFTYFLPFLLLLLQSTPSTPLPLYTGTVYVLIPDVHRSGGPACLHSLHAQLNQLTITSYMFNLLPQYTTPHSRPIPLPLLSNVDQPLTSMPQVLATKPLVIDYLINHLTPHDWIVVPTHWIDSDYFTQKDMERFSNTGARTLVYLLGVAYPWDFTTPSNNNPGLVVGFKLQEITQGFASVLPLSNYIATYYQLPHKHIVALAPLERIYYIMHQEYMKLSMAEQRHRKKRILVDADLTGDLYIPTDLLDKYEFVLLEGKNIKELIDLYQTAVIIIDLHFNGPERTVWEAILFDCYPIVAHQGNGGDDIDIPIPSQYKVDALDVDLNRMGTSDLYAAVRAILKKRETDPNALVQEFSSFKQKVLSMPNVYQESLRSTFDSSSVTVVLGSNVERRSVPPERYQMPAFVSPRRQRKHKEVEQYEQQIVACLISVLYHLPLATVIIHTQHVQDFIRRHQRLFRELTQLGLSNEDTGGERHHSVQVLPPIDALNASHHSRGNVQFQVTQGSFVLLGTKTVYDTAACLQSHVYGEEAGLILNDGSTVISTSLIDQTSAERLNQRDRCALGKGLPDLLDISNETRTDAVSKKQREELELLKQSPLGRLTGVFDAGVFDGIVA